MTSKAIKDFNREFEAVRPHVYTRSRGRCETRCSPRCRGKGDQVHHRKLRAQGGTNDLVNLLHVCTPCHDAIHSAGEAAYQAGLLVHGWDEVTPYTGQKLSRARGATEDTGRSPA